MQVTGSCTFRADERVDFQAVVEHMLLWRVYTTRAAVPVMRKQRERAHPSGVSSRRSGFPAIRRTRAKWGRWRFSDSLAMESRRSGQDLHARTGAFDQLGTARCVKYARPAAGLRGLGRSVPRCCEESKGARKAIREDRGRNSATGEQRRRASAADPGVDAESACNKRKAARASEAEKWRHLTVQQC